MAARTNSKSGWIVSCVIALGAASIYVATNLLDSSGDQLMPVESTLAIDAQTTPPADTNSLDTDGSAQPLEGSSRVENIISEDSLRGGSTVTPGEATSLRHAQQLLSSSPDLSVNSLERLGYTRGGLPAPLGCSIQIWDNTIVVGCPTDAYGNDDSGITYVFCLVDGQWLLRTELLPTPVPRGHAFGHSVAIHNTWVAVGAPAGREGASGYVSAYKGADELWQHTATLTPPASDNGGVFGYSVALSETTLLVGSPPRSDSRLTAGSAYFFHDAPVWSLHQTITSPDGSHGGRFGHCVAVFDDLAVVGCPSAEAAISGRAFVYARAVDEWKIAATLSPLSVGEQYFGSSIALGEGMLLVGCPGVALDHVRAPTSRGGRVYVFRGFSGSWQEAGVLHFEGADRPEFGSSLALYADRVLVGAPSSLDHSDSPGVVCVFVRTDQGWSQSSVLESSSSPIAWRFGTAVSLNRSWAAVTSWLGGSGPASPPVGGAAVLHLDSTTLK